MKSLLAICVAPVGLEPTTIALWGRRYWPTELRGRVPVYHHIPPASSLSLDNPGHPQRLPGIFVRRILSLIIYILFLLKTRANTRMSSSRWPPTWRFNQWPLPDVWGPGHLSMCIRSWSCSSNRCSTNPQRKSWRSFWWSSKSYLISV